MATKTRGGSATGSGNEPRTRITIQVKEDAEIGFILELDPNDIGKGVEVESRDHVIKVRNGEYNPYELHIRLDPPSWRFGSPALVWFPPPQKYLDLSGDPLGKAPMDPTTNRRNVRVPADAAETAGGEVSFDFFLFIEDSIQSRDLGHTVLVRPSGDSPFKDPTIILNPPPP